KGHQYGTILVDLEKHQPLALLPDRQADTLADWLREHPGIEIISRDRSKTYKSAITAGAPDALQVADRFHLLQNLEEALENVFSSESTAIKTVEYARVVAKLAKHQVAELMLLPEVDPLVKPTARQSQSRARRLAKYEQVHALRQQGHRIKDIAHHVGIDKKTVYKFLAAPTFPEYKSHTRRKGSGLDRYKPYLLEQWRNGRYNTKELFEAIQQQGYKGGYSTVARYTHKLRQSLPPRPSPDLLKELPGRGPAPDTKVEVQKPLTVTGTAWLVMRKVEHLTEEDEEILEQLSRQPELSKAIDLTQSFLFIVRKRLPQHLDLWLERAKNSALIPFQRFAKGLLDDYEAVKAALTLEVSNGQVEGQNNRLKMVKRQMYGRAGLDLLNKRLVLTS
ncbi:ISL3 family transposase, partial [Acaryochloris marina NIES-2412]|uniref:ISL3 family transposase n=1 Tax=Acaryochloris marina TaxID=155978 RepID=UPI004058D8CB